MEPANEQTIESVTQGAQRQIDLLIEHMPLAVTVFGTDTKVLRWNAAAERLFGWTAEEVLGRSFLEFHIPARDRSRVEGLVSSAFSGAPQRHAVHTNMRKDGTELKIEWFTHVLRDPAGAIVGALAMAQDVTAREKEGELVRLLSAAIRNSTDAVVVTRERQPGEDAPRIVFVNTAFERITGWRADEVIGRTPRVLHGPRTDRAILDSLRPRFERHERFDLSLVQYRKDGSEYLAELNIFPVADETGRFTHWVSIQTDVTERHRAKQLIEESERRYRRLVEEAGDLIYACDEHGRITYANGLVLRFTGYEEAELLHRHYTKCVAPTDRARVFEFYLAQHQKQTRETSLEFRIVRRNGDHRWVQQTVTLITDGTRVTGFNAIMRDIHERRAAEEELLRAKGELEQRVDQRTQLLAEALRRYETLIQNMPGVVFRSTFDEPIRLLFLSDAVEELTGHPAGAFLGEEGAAIDLVSLIHPADRGNILAEIREATREGRPYDRQFRLRHRDGTERHVREFGRMVLDSQGRRVIEGVLFDVTAEALAKAERERLEKQLQQSQKMEAIGQLAGGIAHDFNNLLQVITTYAQFAIRGTPEDSRTRRDLDQILKAARSASQLTKQLLAFGRRQILQPVNVRLDEVVREVMGMLNRLIGENIRLELVPGFDICIVRADPGQIEQVLVNLCVNARDAMPHGGSITIKIKNVAIDDAFVAAHPAARTGEFVRLGVTDTGTGMPPEVREHIFEPFYTTKAVGKGTGMGLATVHGIVTQHNGFILVDSEPGNGTTFDIYLPVVAGHVRTAELRMPVGDVPHGTETLLLAEDEDAVRESLIRILEEAGYRVYTARNGAEAVELFKAFRDEIDLFVSDVVMPSLSGREAYQRMAAAKPGLRVLFTSGYSITGVTEDFQMTDDMHMIQKPYETDVLLRKIREVLDA